MYKTGQDGAISHKVWCMDQPREINAHAFEFFEHARVSLSRTVTYQRRHSAYELLADIVSRLCAMLHIKGEAKKGRLSKTLPVTRSPLVLYL